MKSADLFVYVKIILYLCSREGASRPSLSMKHRLYMGDQTLCTT